MKRTDRGIRRGGAMLLGAVAMLLAAPGAAPAADADKHYALRGAALARCMAEEGVRVQRTVTERSRHGTSR